MCFSQKKRTLTHKHTRYYETAIGFDQKTANEQKNRKTPQRNLGFFHTFLEFFDSSRKPIPQMQGSGGFPPSRGHGTDRFYNPPAIRRQLQQQQQQQLQRQPPSPSMKPKPVAVSEVREAENRADSDESPSKPSVCSPPRTPSGNLDRFVEAMAPTVPAQYFSKVVGRWRKKVWVLMSVWFDLMGFV